MLCEHMPPPPARAGHARKLRGTTWSEKERNWLRRVMESGHEALNIPATPAKHLWSCPQDVAARRKGADPTKPWRLRGGREQGVLAVVMANVDGVYRRTILRDVYSKYTAKFPIDFAFAVGFPTGKEVSYIPHVSPGLMSACSCCPAWPASAY